jgi:pantoate--beta-alanine ligase
MKICKSPKDLQKELSEKNSIGFVPTMGALHDGHKKLLEVAKSENEAVVLSIFVNPTQFLEGEDFSKYPRTVESDLEIAKKIGIDFVFLPTPETIYFSDEISIFAPKVGGFILEGEKRAGHFNGVLQVVLKLFNIVRPHRAYFGEKDWQQLSLIQRMVRDLFLQLEIVPVQIVRDTDEVALSSRNRYLSEKERKLARKIPQSLKIGKVLLEKGKNWEFVQKKILENLSNLLVEYVELWNDRILIAVKVGETRLIDNIGVEIGNFRN